MKKVSVLFLASIMLYACGSADSKTAKSVTDSTTTQSASDSKVSQSTSDSETAKLASKEAEIASQICNCFKSASDSMSSTTKDYIRVVSKSADPDKAFNEELSKIKDPEQMMKIASEFSSFGDESSPTNQCLIKLKANNKAEIDDRKFMDRVVKELEGKPECDLSASIMRVRQKTKNSKIKQ